MHEVNVFAAWFDSVVSTCKARGKEPPTAESAVGFYRNDYPPALVADAACLGPAVLVAAAALAGAAKHKGA